MCTHHINQIVKIKCLATVLKSGTKRHEPGAERLSHCSSHKLCDRWLTAGDSWSDPAGAHKRSIKGNDESASCSS